MPFGKEPQGTLLSSQEVAKKSLEVLISDINGQIIDVRKSSENAVRTLTKPLDCIDSPPPNKNSRFISFAIYPSKIYFNALWGQNVA